MVINPPTTAGNAVKRNGDGQMRIFSFILALAFTLAGPSMAGSADGSLPGVGTFAYHGPGIAYSAQPAIVMAAR